MVPFTFSSSPFPFSLLDSLKMWPPYWKTREGKYEEVLHVLCAKHATEKSRSWGHAQATHQPWDGPLGLLFDEMNKSLVLIATISQYFWYFLPNAFLADARGRNNLIPSDFIINVLANNGTTIIVLCSLSFHFLLGKTGNCPWLNSSLSCSENKIIYVRTL